jgi:hypothetical protein
VEPNARHNLVNECNGDVTPTDVLGVYCALAKKQSSSGLSKMFGGLDHSTISEASHLFTTVTFE